MIDIHVPLKPISVNQAFRAIPRGNFCTSIKSKEYRQFESNMLKLLPKKPMVKGEIAVTIEYYLKNRYSVIDLDNLTKPVVDCLATAGYFENDKYITSLNLTKYKADEDSMHIIITEA